MNDTIKSQIAALSRDALVAEGQAYYEINRKIGDLAMRQALGSVVDTVGPMMPEWVRNLRSREAHEESLRERIGMAMVKMDKVLAGSR